jgi:hypothetical protein
MHPFATAMGAVFRPILLLVPLVAEGSVRTTGDEINAPTVASVTPVGSAPWDIGFSPKADAAPATIPCLDPNAGLIDEHQASAVPTCSDKWQDYATTDPGAPRPFYR